jgi:uncharacterized membrane protein YeaQ/YmgE (transglycosylase-associated protein family)
MNIIIWLIVGALVGWVASRVVRIHPGEGILLNVVAGGIGGVFGGWLLSPLLGVSSIDRATFSLPSLFVSFMGAVILLVFVTFTRRRAER